MIKYVSLSKENILNRVSQQDIMESYLGIRVTESLVTSPLRKDTKPGCSFYVSQTGKLYFRD
jgi:hypothetical protein